MADEKFYIDVPYEKKSIAKSAGAKWDAENSCWYLNDSSHALFAMFKAVSEDQLLARNTKVYLDVPYELRSTAKEGKARWDPEARSWYVMGLGHPLMEKFPLKDH